MIYCVEGGIFSDDDGVGHRVYGIAANDSNGSVSASYLGIFFDKRESEDFVSLRNKSDLSFAVCGM